MRRWIERLLVVIGVLCLGYFVYSYAEARLYQSFEDEQLDAILQSAPQEAAPSAPAARRPPPAPGSTVGRIEIPRLGVSSVVRAGSDARTLRLAVGYIPGTALPGEIGNVGLAGHRDTFFRKLRDINPDDEIRVTTPDGVFHYFVQRTSIVQPKDVWVLDPTDYPALTLVTCYPFSYIGSAPQRFIVRAALKAQTGPANAVATGFARPVSYNAELNPQRQSKVVDDSRHLQSQRRVRQDDNRRERRDRARAQRAVGTTGRSAAGHGRVDLRRRPARGQPSVGVRAVDQRAPAKRRPAKDPRHSEPATRTWFFVPRGH
jgi:sortase A